jgi:hypothetical protein
MGEIKMGIKEVQPEIGRAWRDALGRSLTGAGTIILADSRRFDLGHLSTGPVVLGI